MGVNPTSPVNSNNKDLPVLATTAGTSVLPRGARSSAAGTLNYGVAGQVGAGIGPNGDYEFGVDPQGALYVMPEEMAMADAGDYYRAGNATIGTAISYSVVTAWAATSAFLIMRNTAAGGGLRVYPDYIRLLLGTAPASATAMHYAMTLDPTNRYTSGGTVISGTNTNLLSSIATAGVASVICGAPTIAAAGANVRTVTRGQVRSVIPVVGDQYVFQFGGLPQQGQLITNSTNPAITQISVPPVVLAPGNNHSLLLHLWFPGNVTTAAQFEIEVGFWER